MRRKLTTLHLALAAFFLPVALMFAFTGGLYTLAVKGSFQDQSRDVALTAPLSPDLASLVALATAELDAAGIEVPSGGASVKKAGTSFELEWTGVERDVVLKPTAEPLMAKLVVRDTTPWRHLVQLHKAKGSDLARYVSVAWATGLVVILLSGVVMGYTAPAFRGLTLKAAAAGFATFLVYVLAG